MNVGQLAKALALEPVTGKDSLEREIAGCYVGDLLSCAMAKARKNYVWLTVQSHANVVAVAVLLELGAVVITEGNSVDQPTLDKAKAEGVVLLTTPEAAYPVAGKIWELGIRCNE